MRGIGRAVTALVAIGVAGALGIGITLRVMQANEPPQRQQAVSAVAVQVQPIEVGSIRHVRHFTGTLQARTQYEVAPRIAGRLESLPVDIGDLVERDQIIAQLDDDEYLQEVEQARAELEVALAMVEDRRSSLESAQREYDRIDRLRHQQIASEAELDAADTRLKVVRAGVRVAEAQVAQRQAALRAAQVRLSYTRIRATWQGDSRYRVVAQRFVDAGTTLSANMPILTLIDIDNVTAVINVAERDYRDLSIGQQAHVYLTGDPITGTQEQAHIGRVVRMAPLFFEGSRQARVEIDVPNPHHLLKPGMFVRVGLELGREEQAVIAPRQALVTREGRQGVFLLDERDKIARFIPVQVGILEQQRVQLLDPLLEGQVVVLGQHLLSDQTPVVVAQGPALTASPGSSLESLPDSPSESSVESPRSPAPQRTQTEADNRSGEPGSFKPAEQTPAGATAGGPGEVAS